MAYVVAQGCGLLELPVELRLMIWRLCMLPQKSKFPEELVAITKSRRAKRRLADRADAHHYDTSLFTVCRNISAEIRAEFYHTNQFSRVRIDGRLYNMMCSKDGGHPLLGNKPGLADLKLFAIRREPNHASSQLAGVIMDVHLKERASNRCARSPPSDRYCIVRKVDLDLLVSILDFHLDRMWSPSKQPLILEVGLHPAAWHCQVQSPCIKQLLEPWTFIRNTRTEAGVLPADVMQWYVSSLRNLAIRFPTASMIDRVVQAATTHIRGVRECLPLGELDEVEDHWDEIMRLRDVLESWQDWWEYDTLLRRRYRSPRLTYRAVESESQFICRCVEFVYPRGAIGSEDEFIAEILEVYEYLEDNELNLEGKISGTETPEDVFYLTRIYLEYTLAEFELYHPSVSQHAAQRRMAKLKTLVSRLGAYRCDFDAELAWLATLHVQKHKWRGSMRWIDYVRQGLGLDDHK